MIGEWLDIGPVSQIAPGHARTLPVRGGEEIAVFHTLDNRFYALVNRLLYHRLGGERQVRGRARATTDLQQVAGEPEAR